MRGEQTMIFYTDSHKKFYNETLERAKVKDCYSKSLIYVLGIMRETRENFDKIYDVENNRLKTEAINEPFQTSGTLAMTRFAFNLFGDIFFDVCNAGDDETPNADKYTPVEIFKHWVYLEFLFEAVRIRLEKADEAIQEIID